MSDRLEPGTIVDGRYRIEHRLGSGGMADVYCATDLQLDRKMALKVLYGRFAQDPEFVERFRREASAAAGLQHQNIVAVYDRGEWEGTYYIAMEYLEGQSLKALIQQYAPFDPEIAIAYTTQILRAARFAHRRGVIHRDLKPHNVIVDDEGMATVTDFGIARAGASEMTQTGSIMGTAQYLSPEQAQGLPVSQESDLYSVGIVLYEMLTARVPFEGESAVAIALKQVSEAPTPPRALNPAVSPALDAVVLRALAKDPAARFPDADAFIDALEAARNGVAPSAAQTTVVGLAPATSAYPAQTAYAATPRTYAPVPPSDDARSNRWWIVAIIALLVAGAIVAALLLTRTTQVVVPSVVGSDSGTARSVLEREGFSTDEMPKTSSRPKGEVIGQNPAGGAKADKGSLVTITVSDGPGMSVIPDVTGLSAAQARRRLENAGLRVRVREKASEDVKKGEAIETIPAAGQELARGSTVTLVVSSGPEKLDVPSVVGQQQADAQTTLITAGFKVEFTEREDAKAEPGTVLAQSPAAGKQALKGSTVQLVIATRPAFVTVPDTVGDDEATALRRLEALGLIVVEQAIDVDSEDQDGIVVEQRPQSGKVEPGSTVTIGVGTFTPNPSGLRGRGRWR
ncbi:unannotated protein [freshwater metagenome]|uniref:Unannotated protein n=1 Tax=freshwater metagenome TaxID=449393 RepID=A0A6J7H029_9ZZZZ|nr:Stk1 family PASTA domain-containing Ser/Thr kinase [Actinomycetota bacterium]